MTGLDSLGKADRDALVREVRATIGEKVDLNRDTTDEEIRELVTGVVFDLSVERYLSIGEKRELIELVFNSMRRLDVLQPIIDDPTVTEIMVNGPGRVFIERSGRVSETDIRFESPQRLEDVIQAIVSRTNRAVNESSPIVDARLSDGSRINVVLPPVALNGPILTIRKFPEKPLTMEQLTAYGSVTPEVAGVLRSLVLAKYNIFICGGTGSGKTTFLNALAGFIPGEERVITIEDSAELQIPGLVNLVSLETRNANMEGKGQISMRDLIKTSLRMRPERIVVGEVRGAEALDMLQAMNTGHDGSLSTGHANSTTDMLSRLETMVLCAAPLPLEAIRLQLASAVDILIHLARLRDRSRRVMEISEVGGCRDGQVWLNPLYEFQEAGKSRDERVDGQLVRTRNPMLYTGKYRAAGISCPL